MSKGYYGEYRCSKVKGLIKDVGADKEKVYLTAKDILRSKSSSHSDTCEAACVMTEISVMSGEGEHLFISDDVEKIAIKSVLKMSVSDFATSIIGDLGGVIYRKHKKPVCFYYGGVGDSKFILACVENNSKQTDYYMSCAVSDIHNCIESILTTDELKLVAGLAIMRNSFPELFSDGLPSDASSPNHYKRISNKKTCNISGGTSSTPHVRCGHFRILTHERYKNKRGKAVFVRQCMVKGHASHTK